MLGLLDKGQPGGQSNSENSSPGAWLSLPQQCCVLHQPVLMAQGCYTQLSAPQHVCTQLLPALFLSLFSISQRFTEFEG